MTLSVIGYMLYVIIRLTSGIIHLSLDFEIEDGEVGLLMTSNMTPPIKGIHHAAYRCKDSEETRKFYEDFLGLKLVETLELSITKTGRQTKVLHTFL